jgi:molecular chaperone GrpE
MDSRKQRLDVDHELPPHQASTEQEGGQQGGAVEASSQATHAGIRAERDALIDRLARTQADFENARKRISRDQQEYKDFALAEALKALLPILDSFDWAFQAPANSLEEFRGGVDLIRKQLHETLGKLGLKSIAAKGQPFDPHIHEAVEVVDDPNLPDNQVVEELQRGYKLRERLLRPAMVLVARNAKQ